MRVDTIENRRDELTQLLPEARIAVAHGQMPERELERVMRLLPPALERAPVLDDHRDRHRRPSANTILIHRADKFGSPSCTSCAGVSGARTTRRTRTPHARPRGALGRGEEAARGDPDDGGPGAGFYLAMHDLENPRRGRSAGANRNRAASTTWASRSTRDARARGAVVEERRGAGPRRPHQHRDPK